MRAHVLSLCADYHARVRIVYVEASCDLLFAQNQAREHTVPAAALNKMFDRWEVPDLTEAHTVDYVALNQPLTTIKSEAGICCRTREARERSGDGESGG